MTCDVEWVRPSGFFDSGRLEWVVARQSRLAGSSDNGPVDLPLLRALG